MIYLKKKTIGTEMNNITFDKINKICLDPLIDNSEDIRILWIVGTSVENRDTMKFKKHVHTFFEVHIVTEGEVAYGIGDSTVHLMCGDLLIIKPRLPHRVISHSDGFMKVSVAFTARDSADAFCGMTEGGFMHFPITDSMSKNLAFLAEYGDTFGAYSDDILKSRLKETVYMIADSMTRERKRSASDCDARVFRAKKHVEDNPQVFFSCDEIAAYCRLSTKQISRLFEKYEGKTLFSYIHDNKIDLAKELLNLTNETQEAIAERLGFGSVHYFNKFFLRHTGITPGDYRKQIKK